MFKCEQMCGRLFKGHPAITKPSRIKTRGGVVNIETNFSDQARFSTQDILWALGIWAVILGLSPMVVFYMLMVA